MCLYHSQCHTSPLTTVLWMPIMSQQELDLLIFQISIEIRMCGQFQMNFDLKDFLKPTRMLMLRGQHFKYLPFGCDRRVCLEYRLHYKLCNSH